MTTKFLTITLALMLLGTTTSGISFAQVANDVTVNKIANPSDIVLFGTGSPDTTTVTISVQGYGGSITETLPLNVVLTLDESGSLDSSEFQNEKDAADTLLDLLDSSRDQAGIVGFASNSRTVTPITSIPSAINALNGMIQTGGATNFFAGIDRSIDLFDAANPPAGEPKVIIFFTDGLNNRQQSSLPGALTEAASKNIIIYAIGIGNNVDQNQLINVAGDASRVFNADFNSLNTIVTQILTDVVINTSPTQVNLVEVTNSNIVAEGNFSVPPISVVEIAGQTEITWENIAQHTGNGDNRLSADETFVVSFTAGSDVSGLNLPINDLVNSAVEYVAPDGIPVSTSLPQALINVNSAPVADDDGYSTPEDTPLTVSAPGVLDGDTDADGDLLSAILDLPTIFGTLTLNSDGSFEYTPNPDFNGGDEFTYHANDGIVDSNIATATIEVTPVNDPPVANDDSFVIAEDTSLNDSVTGSDVDGDSLTFAKATDPANGVVFVNPLGTFTYTPNADYNGNDSFTFVSNDGTVDSAPATIDIEVTPVNDPPVADDAFFNTKEDTSLNDSVTGSDVDGDSLTFAKATDPANGIVTVNPDGTFTYTPNFGFVGTDIFEFTSYDGHVNSESATVAVTVIPLTPIEQKDRSLDKLNELIATPGIDKKTTKNLEKSIKDLEKSLDDKFWEDKSTSTLDSKKGHHAIHEEEKSVKDLMKIIKDDKEDQSFLDMVQQVIDRIVKADRTLADGAIDLAEEFEEQEKVQKELDKARDELQKGDDKLVEGEFDKAIHHYEKAWKHAQKAMKKAVEE
ncbi:tandem-95 repeat protein [Nitrosopumilus adriaticus]|uniref:tandem-95 repeat protein n=1 Tax=Nitrosopumilus adriaticus TaxID=1580092 RepID=UPI00352F5F75